MKRFNSFAIILLAVLCAVAGLSPNVSATLPSGNGQTTKAKSVSVTIASDQTVPVSGTITVDTSSLATSALQTTGNTSLATIATNTTGITQPTGSSAVTASDSTVLTCTKGLWVGTAGNLSLKLSADSAAVTWKNVPSGSYVPGSVIRVMAATTAADVVCVN